MPNTIVPDNVPGNGHIIETALACAGWGWPMIACHTVTDGIGCTCGKDSCRSQGKHPRTDLCPNGVKSATLDLKVIADWPCDINIAVALGKVAGGLMAFDVDDPKIARDLIEIGVAERNMVSETGARGVHIFFICTGNTASWNVKRKSGGKIGEVRGDGSYVILPPSKGLKRPYRWLSR
jgi:hypothetical protein